MTMYLYPTSWYTFMHSNMLMLPSSGKTSMKSSLCPLMLRKCRLNILPRVPNQRIMSNISSPGSSSISDTVPWQKFSPW